jgi:soluble lytic murein transglycosylase-like protein/TolA-binding protein
MTRHRPSRRVAGAVLAALGAWPAIAAPPSGGRGTTPTRQPPAVVAARPDVRIEIVGFLLQDDVGKALLSTDRALRLPAAEQPPGLHYLRAHLLELEGRQQEAADEFARAMSAYPALTPYARYRLAVGQARLGHPEVAAGLLATMLGDHPPPSLAAPALRLLRGAIGAGGDCRLLHGIQPRSFAAPERRQLELAQTDCQWRAGGRAQAVARWTAVLEEEVFDDAAREASERLAESPPETRPARTDILLGLAFNVHRDYERSTQFLAGALKLLDAAAPGAPKLTPSEAFTARYALGRNDFWLGRYDSAAQRFEALANSKPGAAQEAQALYQEGRAFEMLANWRAASAAFRRALQASPAGEFAPSALYSALRVEWIAGNDAEALRLNAALAADRRWKIGAGRAALFLASSDIVRGRADRAATFLAQAERNAAGSAEIAFWRGRLHELGGKADAAVLAYADSLRFQPYGLIADAARGRLASPALTPAARAAGERLASATAANDLLRAWLLLGDDSPRGGEARVALGQLLARDARQRTFLYLAPLPVAAWPLWRASLRDPEETLLALGLWSEGAPAVSRYFPLSDPALALTGAQLMARGGEVRRTLYVAEILSRRVPSGLPPQLLPAEFRRILFPLPWRDTLETEARRRAVDPSLLAAVVREESRFDPRAISAASARGLAQFILPTALGLGRRIGLGELSASDLERPEISLALGAAYLGDLQKQLGGAVPAVAAYNAGEVQAELWRAYCTSREPAEYFTKVSFRETRGYVDAVLASRAQYRELYTRR